MERRQRRARNRRTRTHGAERWTALVFAPKNHIDLDGCTLQRVNRLLAEVVDRPEEEVPLSHDELARVRAAFDALDPLTADLVEMRYRYRKSEQVAANITGVGSQQAAAFRLGQASRRLAALMLLPFSVEEITQMLDRVLVGTTSAPHAPEIAQYLLGGPPSRHVGSARSVVHTRSRLSLDAIILQGIWQYRAVSALRVRRDQPRPRTRSPVADNVKVRHARRL